MECIDEEVLLDFVEGSLSEAGRRETEAHIDTCIACRQLVAHLAESDTAATVVPAEDSSPFASHHRYNQHETFELSKGRIVDDTYEIIRSIGRGGMGTLYLAHDRRLARPVALKLIRRELLKTGGFVQRFIFEARVTARFSHPNIIAVYGAGEVDGRPYLVLEYVDGETLSERLARSPALESDEVVRIGLSVARALQEAHRHGVLHRDLKPANVMFTRGGHVKVLDFGLARLLDRPADEIEADTEEPSQARAGVLEFHNTRTHGIKGTPSYMAPEQWRGDLVTEAVDIWALGLLLFEMLFRKYPFAFEHLTTLRTQISSPNPVAIPPLFGVHAGLRRIVIACLEKDPEKRPSTTQVVLDLERIDIRPNRGRNRRRLTGFGAALAMAMGTSLLFWKMREPERRTELPTINASNINSERERERESELSDTSNASNTVVPSKTIAPSNTSRSPKAGARPQTSTGDGKVTKTRRDRPHERKQVFGRLNIQALDGGQVRAVVVILDGRIVGETPLQLANVSEGEHFISIRHDRFEEARRRVRVRAGEATTVLFELMPRRPSAPSQESHGSQP